MHLKCYQCTSCGINPVFTGLSPTYGQVTYALLTRAPVSAPKGISLDLHVLGLSLAFILSQDQTLRCILFILHFPEGRMVRSPKNRLGHQVESKFIDGKALHLLYPRIVLLVYSVDKSFKDHLLSSWRC